MKYFMGLFLAHTLLSCSAVFVPPRTDRRELACHGDKFGLFPKQQLGEFEPLGLTDKTNRKVALLDYSCQEFIQFEDAWAKQNELLDAHLQRLAKKGEQQFLDDRNQQQRGTDTIIMLQHAPVYTLGTGSDEKFILQNQDSIHTVRVDRGGEVTFHGPGQLTVYPVVDLRGYNQDIHWYIRALEEAVIIALSKYGVPAERQDGITGVWVENFKVAAVGVKCRRWITMHGVAVNILDSSLTPFDGIVPCGLVGRQVGCLNQFLLEPITVQDFSKTMADALEEVFRISLKTESINFLRS